MCTSIVLAEEALPLQPEIVMELVTVARSGMVTFVPLVTGLQPGGGGVPEPTNSSRFGEPVPGFVILFGVALVNMVLATVAGDIVGLAPRISAAAPATLIVLVAVSLVFHAEVMPSPGAKMSVQVP